MAETVGAHILERLHGHGVRLVYGYPGDGINGILGAFHDAELEFVQAAHEELSAFMATAHAKFSGDVGVCLATSGPGAIHLLNGLYDAKLDHQPVVAIVGQQKTISLGSNYQQEVDLQTLFKDVASEYVQTVMAPAQVTHVIDRAVQIARATRSVTAVIIPSDIQEEAYEAPPREHGATFSGGSVPRPRVLPQREDLQRAAEVLNAGERVAVLVGAGAREAAQELEELAELLGAGVAKALNGKDVLPDDLPYVTGSIGLLGTKPSDVLMQECDTLLMVGSSFPYSEWLPEPGQARGVQIDLDATRLGIRYPMEVNLAGDARDTLRELLPLLRRKENRGFQERIMDEGERWQRILDDQAEQSANPLNPLKVFHELSPRLPDGAIVTADSGSSTNWYARHLRFRRGMRGALSGTLATMGPALPYALAAKFVHPDRPVIAVEGDGAMQMNGINALIDVAKHRHRWTDPRFVVLVLNNRDLNQVTWEQRVLVGDAKLEASQVVPDFPYARYAELLGFKGIRVDAPEQVGAAWDAALAADVPVVLEAVTDPEVPPLPPHITFEQAKNLASALAAGDPARRQIVRQALKGKLQEFINR
ncbi:thiamine pyrophosphate-requiring protein [Solirubrobacter sp. CPCC 204708]|uniref:Thiamine pyrophosphate-requiring protein n=1 Tax=Solirubrobacter deserti TaxID=2282478 RepID=A0ABT4RE70_9ACTN|nr:thiamine pyrophosphate-requiring protein [Solirubrobacter deserti]MBE2316079.1 thiamine pyrophosphate-requiring protein [Solirubrobacter deserti]MDA0136829.1 thiamine pyrophosphate-requiring protein [Solirubrobacter deserti]